MTTVDIATFIEGPKALITENDKFILGKMIDRFNEMLAVLGDLNRVDDWQYNELRQMRGALLKVYLWVNEQENK
jgi:hypothetical protein